MAATRSRSRVVAASSPGPAAWPVAVVTDSTASLPDSGPAGAGPAGAGLTVVPLRLLAGALVADDGGPGVAAAIEGAAARGERLTTARPAPAQFAAAYRAAAEAGASAVLSVHVSGLLSGTVSSAALAAAAAPVPVRVLDARTIGSGLGLVVLAAVVAARAGHGLDAVSAAAGACAEQVGSFFAVDRPGALLAGGRLPLAQPAAGRLPDPARRPPGWSREPCCGSDQAGSHQSAGCGPGRRPGGCSPTLLPSSPLGCRQHPSWWSTTSRRLAGPGHWRTGWLRISRWPGGCRWWPLVPLSGSTPVSGCSASRWGRFLLSASSGMLRSCPRTPSDPSPTPTVVSRSP